MSADRTPELGLNYEGVHSSGIIPTERSSERWSWKEVLGFTLGTTLVVAAGSFAIPQLTSLGIEAANMFSPVEEILLKSAVGLREIAPTVGVVGLAAGLLNGGTVAVGLKLTGAR